MKIALILTTLVLVSSGALSQSQPATAVLLQPCNNGEYSNGVYSYDAPMEFKRFKGKYSVNIRINSLEVGLDGKYESIKLDYNEKIKHETSLIELNDTIAIQFQLFRTGHNNQKNLYFKLKVLYKDQICWRQTGIHQIEGVYAEEMRLGSRSSGGNFPIPRVLLDQIIINIE